MNSWFLPLLLLPLVYTFPLEHRTSQDACGQFDTIRFGSYTLWNNLWGKYNATSGSQCSKLESVNNKGVVKWYTDWQWTGGTGIKSFANIQLNDGINQQLSATSSMLSHWHWGQKNTGTGTVVADVSYDFYTSDSPSGPKKHELMIWLASWDATPISYEYDYNGEAVATATNLAIAGHNWHLYRGSNGYNEVYSFLPVQGSIDSFTGDMYKFFTYLIDTGCIESSEYLVTAQAGMEATSGSVLFVTETYSLAIA